LVRYFGKGNEAVGWQWAMGCLSGLAVVLFLITFATTKERVSPPKAQKSDFRQDLKDLFANQPWLMIAGATVFQLIYIVIRSSSIVYYFKYYVKDQQLNLFGNVINLSFEGFSSSFLLSGTIATIVGAILTKWFAKTLDKKNTYAGFLISSAVLCALFYFLQPQNVWLIYGLNLFVSFFFGPVSVLQWAMYTDTADYGEWKNGRRATALVMAASLFALKLGLTVGGALVGWILGYYGFVANQDQSLETINGIILLMTVFPAIFGIIGGALMIFYPLSNKMMIKIEEELTARRQVGEYSSAFTVAK
jgi:GPH family glycoside/pentoside/hexuronide:cation symporter